MVAYCVDVQDDSTAVDDEGRRAVPQKLFGVRSVHHVPQFLPEFRSIGTSVIFVIPCLANDLSSSK